jgi:hypothetical protein
MPACLAHYQFGQDVLSCLDEKTRSSALAYQQEFLCGLQGPDIFFFYKPYRRTGIRDYGTARHNEPAVRMFAPILAQVRQKAALSYLIGLLCHYVLDMRCHPYITVNSPARYGHQRMEAAFDRHVMLTCKLSKARAFYLPAGQMDLEAMASLWPGIDGNTIKRCINAERRAMRLLDCRRFLETCELIFRKPGSLTPMTLPDDVSAVLSEHIGNLRALYENALSECPGLIRAALDFMGTKLTGGLGFDLNFKGIAPSF